MLSHSFYTFSLLALGFYTVNAKDLDFQDFQDLSGSGLPLGGSGNDDNLSFDDGVRGDSSAGDLSFDDLSSSSPSSSSSLDGLDEALGLGGGDNIFADGTANTFGGGDLDFNDGSGGLDLGFDDATLGGNLNFNDGKGDANLNFKDGYDDSLEPITSTIHTTTTICPVAKDHKPTGAVAVPDSDLQFPDGTDIGNNLSDSDLSFPDGTDTQNTLPDSDLSFTDGTDTQNTLSNSDLSFPDGTDSQDTFPDSDLLFPDGTNSQDSFADSDLSFPDGTDTQNIQDPSLPIGDNIPYQDNSQRVTVTVTQIAPGPTGSCGQPTGGCCQPTGGCGQPTGGCGQPAPPTNELGNVCKQMMAICAPYVGQGVNGLAF